MNSSSEAGGKPAPPRAGVVILNWRHPEDTLACIFSVAASDHENLDIVVCDNDSGDGSFERIAAGVEAGLDALNATRVGRGMRPFRFQSGGVDDDFADRTDNGDRYRRLCLVQTGANGGYAYGNNVGIRKALSAPDLGHVWVLNNDTLVDPGALGALLARMEQDPKIGICGPKIVYLENPAMVQSLGGGKFLPKRAKCELIGNGGAADAPIDAGAIEAELEYVSGAAALVSRAFIEDIGLMDEGYFLYWEEIDWATRAVGRYRLGFSPAAVVYHRVGASIGTSDFGPPSLMSEYYLFRSRFRYLRLYRREILPRASLLLVKRVVLELAAGRAARAMTIWRAAFGPALKW